MASSSSTFPRDLGEDIVEYILNLEDTTIVRYDDERKSFSLRFLSQNSSKKSKGFKSFTFKDVLYDETTGIIKVSPDVKIKKEDPNAPNNFQETLNKIAGVGNASIPTGIPVTVVGNDIEIDITQTPRYQADLQRAQMGMYATLPQAPGSTVSAAVSNISLSGNQLKTLSEMLNFKASDQVNLDQIDSFRINNPQEFELIVSELRKLAVNPNLSDTERKNVLQEYRRIIKTNQRVTLDGNILIGRSRTFRVADKFRKLY